MNYKQQRVVLSPYHQIFYNEQQLNPQRVDYNIAFVQGINKHLDVERLYAAIKQFTSNTYLYHCIVKEDIEHCFWEDSGAPPVLELFNTFDEKVIQAYVKKEFALNAQPACRFALFTDGFSQQIFVAVIHHILIDGLKFDELILTLSELYNNLKSRKFPSLELQKQTLVAENLNFQKKIEHTKLASKKFWDNQLQGLPKSERIFGDTPGNDIYRVDTLDFSLLQKKYFSWKSNLKIQVSDFNIILAVLGVVVTKYCQGSEIPITYPIAINRTDNLILGATINSVITRFSIKKGTTFEDLLLQKKQDIKDELSHSSLPIYEIVNSLPGIKCSVSVAQTNLKRTELTMDSCHSTAIQQNYYYDIAGNDLILEYDFDDENNIHFRIKFREKYSSNFIKNMFCHFLRLLQICLENSQKEISNTSLLSAEEYENILYNFNQPAYLFTGKGTIQETFETIAANMPNKVACIFGNIQLTYDDLNKKSNQIAHYLRDKTKGIIIAICLKRSIEMIIGMLGILKAGYAYLPIDTKYPEDRIKIILLEAKCKIILADNESCQMLRKLFEGLYVINIESNNEILKQSSQNIFNSGSQHDLAYVIYTSGTTGIPKGVLVQHAGVMRLAKNHIHFQITDSDCFLQASSISFDAATFEIWGALLNGATLDLIENPTVLGDAILLKKYLQRKKITILWLTVGLFNQLANQDNTIFSEIKYLLIGGDALIKQVINALVSLPQEVKPKNILNGYGPTENTTFTTLYSIDKPIKSLSSIPIGSPLPGTSCYILDKDLNLVPIGVIGELYIGGQGLARGYLNRPDLTKECFIQNPFIEDKAMLYKTGDLVRWLYDGNIEFMGRNDKQVKIRGFRVELQEIETYLMKLNFIDQCVVLASLIDLEISQATDKYIIAYYTLKNIHTVSEQEIRSFLSKNLPSFMVPTYLVELNKMPLTANGKIDIKQLPLPATKHLPFSDSCIEPSNDIELALKKIFEEISEKNIISIVCPIFDIGIHSLHLLRIAAKIQKIFAINCSISTILEAQSIKSLANKIKLQLKGSDNYSVLIPAIKDKSSYPLSFEQNRLWFLSQYTKKNAIYNIFTIFKINGNLNINILQQALVSLINRHPSLQTSFNEDSQGIPYQTVLNSDSKTTPCIIHQNEITEADLQKILLKQSLIEFELNKGFLYKFDIYKLIRSKAHIFICNIHHIISDAWSLKIFFKELTIIYNALNLGVKEELPRLDIKYSDYAIWQQSIVKEDKFNAQLEYWKKKLADFENLRLPIKEIRPTIKTYAGSHIHFKLDANLINHINKYISKHHCTTHMLLLTVFNLLLQSYTGQNDFIIGIPVTNREQHQLENVIGFFVNLLPIRVAGNTRLKQELLKQIKSSCIEAYANQDIPFDYLVKELQINRDQSQSPLFQVLFNLIHEGDNELRFDDTTIEKISFDSTLSKFDLSLTILLNSNEICGDFEFNTDLLDTNLIQRMSLHYCRILEDFVTNSEEIFYEVNMFSNNELNNLINAWNNTASFYNKNLTIDKLFEAKVVQTPEAVAIRFNQDYLTYSQLNNRSNQLAHLLRLKYYQQQHVELPINSLIAIYLDRSSELAIAILAVIKSGCGFVPIDIDSPEERINLILRDTKAKFIITNSSHITKLNNIAYDITNVIDIENIFFETTENFYNQNLCAPSNLAYVIYTSGSTGVPKGVCISHLSLNNLITSFSKMLPINSNKKFLSLTSYIFDIFYLEFFGTLCFGAELILTDSKLIKDPFLLTDFINAKKPDIIQATPSLWQLIIDQLLPSHKLTILCGGEALYQSLFEKLFRVSNEIWNLYGPTETTIWSSAKKLSRQEKISIGNPIGNTQIFILNKNLQPVPIGVDGELYIGGDGLAKEYLNNPELTQLKFIDIPIKTSSTDNINHKVRLYKTGDFGRWLEDGQIEILGRMDFQVKIRGHRIELSEIEEQLLMHGDIAMCAVVATNFVQHGAKILVAYYSSFNPVDTSELKKYLAKKLPSYLIPDMFISLNKMPLTRNGKIDRNTLSNNIPTYANLTTEKILPQTDVEIILAEIYCSLLNLDEVGIYDNFFDIGGHSINAIQLLTRINKIFATNITLKSIFDYGKIADLSKYIELQKNVEVF